MPKQNITQKPVEVRDGSNNDNICQQYGFKVGEDSYKKCRLDLDVAQRQAEAEMLQFEQQKIIQQLPTADMTDDERAQRLEDTMIAITKITAFAIAKSIRAIKTPSVLVTEPEFIEEFLNNCDRNIYNVVRDRIIDIRKGTDLAPLTVICDECKKTYDQPFVLDTSYFFANAS
jgi:hypothetical protein